MKKLLKAGPDVMIIPGQVEPLSLKDWFFLLVGGPDIIMTGLLLAIFAGLVDKAGYFLPAVNIALLTGPIILWKMYVWTGISEAIEEMIEEGVE